jgi:phosphatidylinositol alpha-1,6-mannosyltransferase
VTRVLVVTNDFPPRRGGIESFVFALCQRLPAEQVVVYTARMPGGRAFDSGLAYPVVRDPTPMVVPTPRVSRRAVSAFRDHGCDRVMFGAAAPLGLLAGNLRSAGAQRIVGLTHGHETWWARVPGARQALRRIGDSCDALTFVSGWCRERIAPGLSAEAAARMVRLAPGVDVERFRPGCGGTGVRDRLGIPAEAPVVVCAARMVKRKGQDTLVRAWQRVLDAMPEARLLLVGDGPARSRVERLAAPLGEAVVSAGAVSWEQIPAFLDAGDVFAMPCRTRRGGLEPEALGIVCLEAAACGLPVVVGDSGGAPETVRHGETGYVVDPYSSVAVATALTGLLSARGRAVSMGARGRAWVASEWTWEASAAALRDLVMT